LLPGRERPGITHYGTSTVRSPGDVPNLVSQTGMLSGHSS